MKKLIIILFFAAAAVFAGFAIHSYIQDLNAGESYEEIRDEVKKPDVEPTEKPSLTPAPEPTEEPKEEPKEEAEEIKSSPWSDRVKITQMTENPIDFEALRAINEDIYAWITIPETAVDYPIVQSQIDDEYYLHRNVYGQDEYAGSIFTQASYNTKTFEDANTVIYGHRMKNGSMFHTLNLYEDKAFFDSSNEVIIYTEDRIFHYTIFAAYLYDTRHLMESYNFEDPEIFKGYIGEVYLNRDMMTNLNRDLTIEPGDKIITLSTCYGADGLSRWLVQAVLTGIEE